MENKVKELLVNNNTHKKEIALNLLFLKYKMICNNKENIAEIDYLSYFCINEKECYDAEIEKLEKYFSIKINIENPFTHEVVKSLMKDTLIKESTSENNKGDFKITVPCGVEYLRSFYSESETDEKLASTIVFNIVNNINIGDTINNITQGMSFEDEKYFTDLLKEYSKEKNEKTFLSKLGKFSERVGEGVFIRVVAKLFDPTNLVSILSNI